MNLIGLLLGLLAIAAIAFGIWLIVTGNFVVGGILILVGIVILYVSNDRGYYRRTPL